MNIDARKNLSNLIMEFSADPFTFLLAFQKNMM